MKRFCLNCGNTKMEAHRLLHDGWRCDCKFAAIINEETNNYESYRKPENFGKWDHGWVDMEDGCLLILRDEEL